MSSRRLLVPWLWSKWCEQGKGIVGSGYIEVGGVGGGVGGASGVWVMAAFVHKFDSHGWVEGRGERGAT